MPPGILPYAMPPKISPDTMPPDICRKIQPRREGRKVEMKIQPRRRRGAPPRGEKSGDPAPPRGEKSGDGDRYTPAAPWEEMVATILPFPMGTYVDPGGQQRPEVNGTFCGR